MTHSGKYLTDCLELPANAFFQILSCGEMRFQLGKKEAGGSWEVGPRKEGKDQTGGQNDKLCLRLGCAQGQIRHTHFHAKKAIVLTNQHRRGAL